MLHELLMSLLGNTGGLFQFKMENSKCKIKVSCRPLFGASKKKKWSLCLFPKLVDNLEYLHPAEVAICNRLADLGNIYAQMSHFVCEYSTEKPICDVFLDDGKAEKQLKCKLRPMNNVCIIALNFTACQIPSRTVLADLVRRTEPSCTHSVQPQDQRAGEELAQRALPECDLFADESGRRKPKSKNSWSHVKIQLCFVCQVLHPVRRFVEHA